MFRQAGSVDIRILSRLSTVCLLALGVSACSSDAVRFTETPFDSPFRTAQAPASVRDPVTTGSIGSAPVQAVPSSPVVRSQALPPPQAVASAPISAPAAPAPMAAPQPSGGSAAGWSGAVGYLHEVALERFGAQLPQMEIYFAGPPVMATAVQRMLVDAKVPPGQVHFDQFY